MFVCCDCCVLSGRGLCEGLITRPEESYRMWRVLMCDLETSKTRRLKPATGLWKIQPKGCNAKKTNKHNRSFDKCGSVFNTSWKLNCLYYLHPNGKFRFLTGQAWISLYLSFLTPYRSIFWSVSFKNFNMMYNVQNNTFSTDGHTRTFQAGF